MPCVPALAVGGPPPCSRDAPFTEPVPPLAAIHWVNAVPDTNKMAFRVVDIVSNAGLFGATFRTGNTVPVGIQAGTRHIRVFFDTTDVVLAQTVLVDTTGTFAANEHYSFVVTGVARSGPLRAMIVHDGAPRAAPAGEFGVPVLHPPGSFPGAGALLPRTPAMARAIVPHE